MRSKLFAAIIIAAIPSVIFTLAQNNAGGGTASLDGLLSVEDKPVADEFSNQVPDSSTVVPKDDESQNNFDWLFGAVNKVIFLVLFGWAAGRVFMQFRRLIVIFLGLLVIFNFALNQTGLVDFIIRYDQVQLIFDKLKATVWDMGFVDFVAIVAGLWAGVKGSNTVGNGPQIVRFSRE